MLLLAQVYAPLDGSPYDRVLYMWFCGRRACTGKPGAASVMRGHLLNIDYALELVRRPGPRQAAENPPAFSGGLFGSSTTTGASFDFGAVWQREAAVPEPSGASDLFAEPLSFGKSAPKSNSPAKDLSAALESLSISPGLGPAAEARVDWQHGAVGIKAQYLAFGDEVLDADVQIRKRYQAEISQVLDMEPGTRGRGATQAGGDADGWRNERYERDVLPQGTDAAFARFSETVSQNPEQVIRYQFSGTPLLYTLQDKAARLAGCGPAGGGDHSDDDEDGIRSSTGSRQQDIQADQLPRCPQCNGRRVFECQLMPALLTVLSLDHRHDGPLDTAATPAGSAARQPQLTGGRLLRSFDVGLEFGTVLVFVCENDCHRGKTGTQYLGRSASDMRPFAGAAYHEELALVQLEAHEN
ncbi:hypothetical protein GGF46_004915 [Coemansia sp. RSA 552]|nr:hypothetical protein GGF46_004915 [Coemansia sp. RSA 552]